MSCIQKPPLQAAQAKRPLYLGCKAEARLDDGPSLVVSTAGMICSRYPLQRISRLIIAAGVRIQADLIPACLSDNIPITWCHHNGNALAVALPLKNNALCYSERVAIVMAQPHWQEHYYAWLSAQHRMALGSLARRFNLQLEQEKQDVWIDALWQRYGIERHQAVRQLGAWQAMVVSMIVEYWLRLDIAVDQLSSPADGWNVLHDMADCLVLDMTIEQLRHRKKWQHLRSACQGDVNFALIQAFERRQSRLLKLLGAMHARFQRWLLDMEPWR